MKKILLVIITIICLANIGKAQVAVVNSQKIIASMKEFAQLDTLIAKETATYTNEYYKKQILVNQFVKVADSLFKIDDKATATNKAIAEAQTADKDLKAFAEVANKKIADYKQLLTKPYTEKVMAAIKVVATRAKYMQVLDSANVNILYLNPLADITEQVIKEIKIK